jgi:hypothetical protein
MQRSIPTLVIMNSLNAGLNKGPHYRMPLFQQPLILATNT